MNDDHQPRPVVQHLEKHTTQLTAAQGGIEWHFIRNGMITSTVAYSVLRLCQGSIPEECKFILDLIGIKKEDAYAAIPSKSELECKVIPALKAMLKARGLPITGAKAVLIERLLTAPPMAIDPVADVMKCWWMRPVTTTAMKMGKANEAKVLRNMRQFMEVDQNDQSGSDGSTVWRIHDIVERGLIGSKHPHLPSLATSNDAIVDVRQSDDADTPIIGAVEVKTKSEPSTAACAERLIAEILGPKRFICTEFGSDLHRRLVPDASHRCQVRKFMFLQYMLLTRFGHILG